jgi:hypothetical protein
MFGVAASSWPAAQAREATSRFSIAGTGCLPFPDVRSGVAFHEVISEGTSRRRATQQKALATKVLAARMPGGVVLP